MELRSSSVKKRNSVPSGKIATLTFCPVSESTSSLNFVPLGKSINLPSIFFLFTKTIFYLKKYVKLKQFCIKLNYYVCKYVSEYIDEYLNIYPHELSVDTSYFFEYAPNYAYAYAGDYTDSYSLENNFINNDVHLSMDGMQEDNNVEYSIDIRRPLVVRALRRSSVRKKIAEYLFEISPSSSYTSEIAYNVKTTPTNVIGALRGMESRYKEEESLVGLGVVEEKKCNKNIKLYGLTDFGKIIMESIDNNK